jgi:OOP family OmpA-OmpF porin
MYTINRNYLFYGIAFLFLSFKINAQTSSFNRWSLEFNLGINRPIAPFSQGYSSENDQLELDNLSLNHFNLGGRYMFNDRLGIKLDFANDRIKNNATASSYFRTNQYRLGIQSVINIGRVLKVEEISNKLGLLFHMGGQIAYVDMDLANSFLKDNELNGGFIFGLTPQYLINNRCATTFDVTLISNIRQHLTWDGNASDRSNNLNGSMINLSFGVVYYLGSNSSHADWVKQ